MKNVKRFIICELCGCTYKKQPITCRCGNDNDFWQHSEYLPAIALPSLKLGLSDAMMGARDTSK